MKYNCPREGCDKPKHPGRSWCYEHAKEYDREYHKRRKLKQLAHLAETGYTAPTAVEEQAIQDTAIGTSFRTPGGYEVQRLEPPPGAEVPAKARPTQYEGTPIDLEEAAEYRRAFGLDSPSSDSTPVVGPQ
jgi:hypothetical protein